MADSTPTTQQLVDYLHTAISENDLLYVHYWLRELEDLGEQGREAIRIGKRESFLYLSRSSTPVCCKLMRDCYETKTLGSRKQRCKLY